MITKEWHKLALELRQQGYSGRQIAKEIGMGKSQVNDFLKSVENKNNKEISDLKILTCDVENSPTRSYCWGLWNNNVSLNQIERDWYIISWAAKWMHEDEVMYQDKRTTWDNEDDSDILVPLWKLMNEADIILGQNLDSFDIKKINARFIMNGMKPPSSYRTIDTLKMARKHFGFTSNKLEYMTSKLCKKYRKLSHGKFPGFELWKACLEGNILAWEELEEYNIQDVLATEELYTILRPWYKSHPNLNVYSSSTENVCVCGNDEWDHVGYHYTNISKFDKFQCTECGFEMRGTVNLIPKDKRSNLMRNIK